MGVSSLHRLILKIFRTLIFLIIFEHLKNCTKNGNIDSKRMWIIATFLVKFS